jgi:diadenylate cyclase
MSWVLEKLQVLQFGWRDAIDILIVAFVIYTILHLIRGTRAMQMSMGIVVLAAGYFIFRWMRLSAIEAVFREVLFYLPFAVIVLFQQEIRQALAAFGKNPLIRFFSRHEEISRIDEVLKAVREISSRRWGALIVMERTESLRTFADSGSRIDAALSAEILVNIFAPNTPLHDGAVIIQGDRVASAATLLPLSSDEELSTSMGTRHRAAIGMSEQTDALVIVVSEENQAISAAFDASIRSNLSIESLRELITLHLAPEVKEPSA